MLGQSLELWIRPGVREDLSVAGRDDASTFALESTDDSVYNSIESQIQALTAQRDTLATEIKDELYGAASAGHRISATRATQQIAAAQDLIAQAEALPSN